MPDGSPTPLALALPTRRLLSVAESVWAGRNAVEGYLDELNRSSQIAARRIHHWEGRQEGAMGLSSVLLHSEPGSDDPGAFMAEFRGSFGIDVLGGDVEAAPTAYVIGLPLAGAVTVTTRRQQCTARAGEGVIFDPAEVRSSSLAPGMHFVEFCLQKNDVARLAGEWRPGFDAHHPRFAPLLSESLAKRLLFMAVQAADALQSDDGNAGSRMMFRRWCEMIALTLLQEQRIDATHSPASAASSAGIRRALDYIHAHADSDIGLADIAEAACLSVSSLLRHFNAQVGVSPYACLKTVRLDRARRELLRDAPELVRDIALRWGFPEREQVQPCVSIALR